MDDFEEQIIIIAEDSDEKKYFCEICKLSYEKIHEYALHAQIHITPVSDTFLHCVFCDFKTKHKSSFSNHVKLHDEDEKYKCELCPKEFNKKWNYEEHLELHGGVDKYKCEYCPKTFVLRRYLLWHKRNNHWKEMYGDEEVVELRKCDICSKGFRYGNSLKRHLRTVHKVGDDYSKKCPICDKVCQSAYYLKMHMYVHTGEKAFICDICGKGFVVKYRLKAHMLKHEK